MVDGTVLYCYYMFERKDKSINEKKNNSEKNSTIIFYVLKK